MAADRTGMRARVPAFRRPEPLHVIGTGFLWVYIIFGLAALAALAPFSISQFLDLDPWLDHVTADHPSATYVATAVLMSLLAFVLIGRVFDWWSAGSCIAVALVVDAIVAALIAVAHRNERRRR